MLARLFGKDTAADRPGDHWLARYLVLAGVLAAIIVLRKPDALLHPQFWAEDGKVFFWEQLTLGFGGALARHYAGFPYLAHRLVAALAAITPIAWVPLAYNAAAIAITALTMATFCLAGFRHLVRSDGLRAAVCVAIVCMPAGQELLATPTDLGWFLAIWLVLLSVMRAPRTVPRVAAWWAGGVLAVWSTPLAPVAAPLWVLRAVAAAPRLDREMGFAGLLTVALLGLVASTAALGAGFSSAPGAATVPRRDAAPDDRLPAAGSTRRVAIALPALIAAGGVALAFRDLRTRGRVTCCLAIYLFACSLYLILAGRPFIVQLLRGEIQGLQLPTFAIIGPRHRALPSFAFLLLLAAIIDGARHLRTRAITAVVACVASGLAWAPEFRVPPSPDLHWAAWAARLEQKLATGSREPLVIPSDPPSFEIRVDAPPREPR